jgi:hypothetical protein
VRGLRNALVLTLTAIAKALPPFEPDEDPKRIAAEAFRLVLEPNGPNFLLVNPDEKFKAACGALFLRWQEKRPELAETIQDEMACLGAISAAQTGVPVNLGAALARFDEREPLGLLGLFRAAGGAP